MASEHNPIAQLITQIQKKWVADASPFPKLKLIRWLIKPEEARLFEGFLKLESTEHGAIPEVLVALLTRFEDETTYSSNLIRDWIKAYREDVKTHNKLKAKGISNSWDYEKYSDPSISQNQDADRQLISMFSSFQKEMIGKDSRLVVALFPYQIYDMKGFNRWLISILKSEIPDEITFMIFDHIGENYFDHVFEKYPAVTKTLHVDLDLNGAVSKIAKMGNPNSPEVKFRECILEMGQSVKNNNQKRLHEWGEKALTVTQRSGMKSMFATAHIVYAGMLFTFKQYEKIDSLLSQGMSIAKQGHKTGDASCKPLLIQYYGYIASSHQLQKKMTEATNAFEKQGDIASEFDLPSMALMPYRQAYTLSKKNLPQRYDELIQKAFSKGQALSNEEKLSSGFAGIAFDFVEWLKDHQRQNEAEKIDEELKKILGNDWKEKAKNPQKVYSNETAILIQ
ncbi:MAG: hypothetical protein ABI855_09330 [Bacteroidota bacterium]